MRFTIPKVIGLLVPGAAIVLLAVNLLVREEKQVRRAIEHRYGVEDPQFARSMGVLLGPGLVDGNRVETLLNGDQIVPAMLEAIRGARKTLTFETYIYWSGKVGKDFADALSERARAGVKVHILLDWVGSQKMDESQLNEMAGAGVEIRRYHAMLDRDFAERQLADFERDLARSRRVTLQEWENRPWTEKAKERFFALFRSQL